MDPSDCKVVQINVSSNIKKFDNSHALTFLVLDGPNNLIGRHSLQKLWPEEFNAFKKKCDPESGSIVSESKMVSMGDKKVPIKLSEKISTNEVKVTSGSPTSERPVDKLSKIIIKSDHSHIESSSSNEGTESKSVVIHKVSKKNKKKT